MDECFYMGKYACSFIGYDSKLGLFVFIDGNNLEHKLYQSDMFGNAIIGEELLRITSGDAFTKSKHLIGYYYPESGYSLKRCYINGVNGYMLFDNELRIPTNIIYSTFNQIPDIYNKKKIYKARKKIYLSIISDRNNND
jgi:hypothetical protein